MIFHSLSLGKYDKLGTRVVNIVCDGHKCNILYLLHRGWRDTHVIWIVSHIVEYVFR